MITGINESKTLTKHILCECKCKFDGTKCKSSQWWNNDKGWCECIKMEKFVILIVILRMVIWNPKIKISPA